MATAALTFDRLAYIDRLKSGGIDDENARAHAAALDAALRDSVATKSDVENLGSELRADIADLKRELHADMANLERELRGDMADLRRELRGDMADLRQEFHEVEVKLEAKVETAAAGLKVDVLRWLIVTQAALGGFIFAVLKFLH